jgi:hypothetical protein
MLQACRPSELDKQEKSSWRDTLPVHPAAALFPLMSSDELQALGADIVKNGLTSPIVLWRVGPSPLYLLDGRNRLDAIEMTTGKPVEVGAPSLMAGEFIATDKVIVLDGRSVDPWTYAISANIHRRHLTIKDKDRLVVELLKADPTKSNRQVAKIVDASHPHVAKVREQAEQAGDVETVTTSVDTMGRRQRAKKTQKKKSAESESGKQPPRSRLSTRNTTTANILRRMKLGDEVVDKLAGTSLGSAAEMDELIILNRGAPEGEHTDIVEKLIADAVAGKDVSAVATAAAGVKLVEPTSTVACAGAMPKASEPQTLAQLFAHAADVLTKLDAAANQRNNWPDKVTEKNQAKIVKEVHDMLSRMRGLRDRIELYAGKEEEPLETATADSVTAGDPGPIPDLLVRKPKATDTSEGAK